MRFCFILAASLAMAQPPVFRLDTRTVEVTVVATRADGSAVTDLRPDEMRIFDRGREQTIASFDRFDAAAGASLASAVAVGQGRPLPRAIVVLDALNTFCGDQIYGREAVSRVLHNVPAGTQRIAIFALDDRFELLQDFSTNSAALRETVDEYEGDRPLFGVDLDSAFANAAAAPCDIFREPRSSSPAVEARQQERWSRTLDAFKTIALKMRTVQGEKSVLWVTDGFPPPASREEMDRVEAELADAKVKLFPVDARGIPAGKSSLANLQTMQDLAEPTGGRAYSYSNDTAALVQAALDDAKDGYLLTFSPARYKDDGSVHELRLKTSRKGVELRYRPSYVARSYGR